MGGHNADLQGQEHLPDFSIKFLLKFNPLKILLCSACQVINADHTVQNKIMAILAVLGCERA